MLTALQLREIELRVQREINEKRQELLAKEESLRYGSFQGLQLLNLTSPQEPREPPGCPGLELRLPRLSYLPESVRYTLPLRLAPLILCAGSRYSSLRLYTLVLLSPGGGLLFACLTMFFTLCVNSCHSLAPSQKLPVHVLPRVVFLA